MERVATEEIDQVFPRILGRIEGCLKQVDASQGSMVRLRKCELDLLGQYEVARDLVSMVLRSGDRALLREIAGSDCGHPGRLRAALAATRLSDMNARDQRFTTCDSVCASFEELARRDLGAAGEQPDGPLAGRTSELLKPARVENSDEEGDEEEEEATNEGDAENAGDEGDEDEEDPDDEGGEEEDEEELGPDLAQEALTEAAGGGDGASAAKVVDRAWGEALARKLFDQIDRNGDGKVTKAEVTRSVQRSFALRRALRVRSMSECARLFEEADLDADGALDFGEFSSWLESFASADWHGDDRLTVEELRSAYAGMLLSAGYQEVRLGQQPDPGA